MTRDELGKLVEDLIQRTFKVCDEAFQQASLTNRDIDGVILVGGPTRLPLVRDAVSEYFQAEPLGDVDPDQVRGDGRGDPRRRADRPGRRHPPTRRDPRSRCASAWPAVSRRR